MHALNELLHTPVPSGTPGRAVAGVSERTRSGAGVEAGENAKSDCERNEPSPTPAPHDAIKRHGFPLPLEAIYAANTISRADFDRLTKGKCCSKHAGRIEAPAYIERMASSEDRVFIAPCEEWARRAASGEAGWAWVKSAPVERGMATALRMIQAAGLGGKVARLSQLASLCRRAPLYGPDSREAVIFGWADTPTLALAIVPQDVRDTSTLEALSTLVNHRRDEMLPTLFISTSTGAAIFSRTGKNGPEAALCADIAETIGDGLMGFSGEAGGKANVIDLEPDAH